MEKGTSSFELNFINYVGIECKVAILL